MSQTLLFNPYVLPSFWRHQNLARRELCSSHVRQHVLGRVNPVQLENIIKYLTAFLHLGHYDHVLLAVVVALC